MRDQRRADTIRRLFQLPARSYVGNILNGFVRWPEFLGLLEQLPENLPARAPACVSACKKDKPSLLRIKKLTPQRDGTPTPLTQDLS